jgi:hypothetical protein
VRATITGWTIGAIGITALAIIALWKAEGGKRGWMLSVGFISALILFTQETVGLTRSYPGRTGMGSIGTVPVEIALLYFAGGILAQWLYDKLIGGNNEHDFRGALYVLAVMNVIIMAAGQGGNLVYSIALVGINGWITARSKVKLTLLALGGVAMGVLLEYINHGTVFEQSSSLIIGCALLCLGFFMGGGDGE